MKRLLISIAIAACAVAVAAPPPALVHAQSAPTPTPPPSPPAPLPSAEATAPFTTATPTPVPGGVLPQPQASSASATVQLGRRGRATPTPAPPKDPAANRVGISGVWEVQIQHGTNTTYAHFNLAQAGTALKGLYLAPDGKMKCPLAGSIDGANVRIVVSMPDGTTLTFSASVDNATDMLGVLDTTKDSIAFTATYRPKYKWIDNLSPGVGGLGGGTPY